MAGIGDSVNQVENLAKSFNATADEVYVVNAGRMNHGKSSLFNALAGNENLFEVYDRPTTIRCDKIAIGNGIILIDTPGIDAREKDTTEALEAYQKADMIMFVHSVNTGELHEDELNAINKISTMFPDENKFWQQFCLILSHSDYKKADEINVIKKKAEADIASKCGGRNFPIFETSSMRYWKGINGHKDKFVEISGIKAVKEFLFANAKELCAAAVQLRQQRLDQKREEEKRLLDEKRKKHQQKISKKIQGNQSTSTSIKREFEYIHNGAKSIWSDCHRLKQEISNL